MELTSRIYTLEMREPFVISRGVSETEDVLQVAIRHGDVIGYGEGAPDERYGETPLSGRAFAERATELLGDDPFALEAMLARIGELPGEMAAKCAIDGALHDLVGKLCGQPVWRLFGLDPVVEPTSYTISIDTVEGTRDRARRARDFRALKVKVGGAEDLERVEAVRAESDAPLRVDANEGWTLESARELMPELIRLDVEFVEQPFPAADVDSFTALGELHPRLPVVVDEGCQDLRDVAPAAAYADGINVKLAKSGGVREAVRMIHAARALGLRVMLGCMVESQLGVAPAAAIASLADWVDLDGHLLLDAQPFTGLRFEDGRVLPSHEPGLGVAPA
jgi:L-Ala-D/L-Glu epimerase / N-acetyl-D-glutamate racemase